MTSVLIIYGMLPKICACAGCGSTIWTRSMRIVVIRPWLDNKQGWAPMTRTHAAAFLAEQAIDR